MPRFVKQLLIIITTTLLVAGGSGPALAESAFPYLNPNGALPEGPLPLTAYRACLNGSAGEETGFYGLYFNLAETDYGINWGKKINWETGRQSYWFLPQNFVFDRVDKNLNFGYNFFPIQNKTKRGDPFHFAVHWQTIMVVPSSGSYTFSLTNDDDAWIAVDGVDILKQTYELPKNTRSSKTTINLSAGKHRLDVFYVERARIGAVLSATFDSKLMFYPLFYDCQIQNQSDNGSPPTGSSEQPSANGQPGGRVLGAQAVAYTKAVALYRAGGSPDIYAIYANGRKHLISGPTAFARYGYKFGQVKTISLPALDKYPDARLLRSPNKPLVYFISARTNNQWLKIPLNSPTVFVSYPNNYWGDMVVVDELDIITYSNVRLVKSSDERVYFLEENVRRPFVSLEVMERLGHNPKEVMEISETHLKSFLVGEPIG